MAKNTSVIENVELDSGGELCIYMASNNKNKVNISFTVREVETNIWITTEEAQELADKINKVLSEIE